MNIVRNKVAGHIFLSINAACLVTKVSETSAKIRLAKPELLQYHELEVDKLDIDRLPHPTLGVVSVYRLILIELNIHIAKVKVPGKEQFFEIRTSSII